MSRYTAGFDWGSEEHALCVLDAAGQLLCRRQIPHTAQGLEDLLGALAAIAPPAEIPVAIERPDGLVVEALRAAGHPVVAIHPNVLKASRSRYRAAPSKSDADDAYILADLLRTDAHRFKPLRPHEEAIRILKAQVRTRDDLVAQRVALTQQLRALLQDFWPGSTRLFTKLASPISLAFLERYPTPRAARSLGDKRMAAFLARQHYSGRQAPQQLLERLRAAPRTLATETEIEAKGELVLSLVRLLRSLHQEIEALTGRIRAATEHIPTARRLCSFPRLAELTAAQLVAEIGNDPTRFESVEHLAALGGVTPITKSSGKRRGVLFRFACNKRLRRALTCFADNSRHSSTWARDIYQRARLRGCDHSHATRILARAWLTVIWSCWKNQRDYDPAKHRAAQRLAT